VIYFIPAKKESKRVKNKNTRVIGGKPLIEWTFESIPKFSRIILSTDDKELISMTPFFSRGIETVLRPSSLCTETAKMSDVLFYHSDRGDFEGEDLVCVLYPTSPFRTIKHINESIAKWKMEKKDSVLMSVCGVNYRPRGLMTIDPDGALKFNREDATLWYQTQNMPIDYRANGAIYLIPPIFIRNRLIDAQLFAKRTIPYIMNSIDGFEIDEENDVKIADHLLRIFRFNKIISSSVYASNVSTSVIDPIDICVSQT